MVNRILELIKELGLSPSQFADEIGVQRSAMSHLVSGRNNPSLEFVMKVLKRFPQVNTEWLLNGSGSMTTGKKESEPLVGTSQDLFQEIHEPIPEKKENEMPLEKPDSRRIAKSRKDTTGEKEIERIIVIYNDRSFRELLPE